MSLEMLDFLFSNFSTKFFVLEFGPGVRDADADSSSISSFFLCTEMHLCTWSFLAAEMHKFLSIFVVCWSILSVGFVL